MKIDIFRKNAFIYKFYGKKYKIDEYEDKSGLYILIKNKEIIYIGVSDCLSRRIMTHKKDKDFDVICILQDETMFYSKEKLETILINIFLPKHNKKVPSIIGYIPYTNKLKEIKEDDYLTKDLVELTESKEGKLTKFLKNNKEMFKLLSEI